MSKAPAPDLTEDQKKQVADTIIYWASVHPRPDEANFNYSPREMAEGLANPDSKAAQFLYRLFANGIAADEFDAHPETLDHILSSFKRDADKWAAEKKSAPKPKKSGGPAF